MHTNVQSSGNEEMVCFLYGGTADGGIILLGALPVFCAVIEEKHALLQQQ